MKMYKENRRSKRGITKNKNKTYKNTPIKTLRSITKMILRRKVRVIIKAKFHATRKNLIKLLLPPFMKVYTVSRRKGKSIKKNNYFKKIYFLKVKTKLNRKLLKQKFNYKLRRRSIIKLKAAIKWKYKRLKSLRRQKRIISLTQIILHRKQLKYLRWRVFFCNKKFRYLRQRKLTTYTNNLRRKHRKLLRVIRKLNRLKRKGSEIIKPYMKKYQVFYAKSKLITGALKKHKRLRRLSIITIYFDLNFARNLENFL